jgi:hypothetical protein
MLEVYGAVVLRKRIAPVASWKLKPGTNSLMDYTYFALSQCFESVSRARTE